MITEQIIYLSICIGICAFLYSSVGHAGASGYIAVLTLFNVEASTIKPIALSLNILVASIGTYQFWKAGYFSWSLFWPFALLSIPFSFLGGYFDLPVHLFKIFVGVVLLLSGLKFLLSPSEKVEPKPPQKIVSIGVGAGIGFLSGVTGTGGGIFLSPLLILMGWAKTKTASAVSALFILLNSISGLAGNISSTKQFPNFAWMLIVTAFFFGGIGSYIGSKKLSIVVVNRFLAIVLFIAGAKLILA